KVYEDYLDSYLYLGRSARMDRSQFVPVLLVILCLGTIIPMPFALTVTSDYSGPIYWGQTVIVRFTIANSIAKPGLVFLAADISNIYVTCSFGTFEYKGAELRVQSGLTEFSLDVPIEITVPWWTEERDYLTVLYFTYFVPQTGWIKNYSFNGPIIQVRGYLLHITGGTVVLIAVAVALIYRSRKKSRSFLSRRQDRRLQI
ncbi:MAG: hypothetical protein JSW01_01740, partial [Candidatus Bathyarchaeota archaeon]